MDGPPIAVLIFLLLFFLVSPDGQRANIPNQLNELQRLLESERYALDVLNKTRFGDFDTTKGIWLNVTGLREEDGYAWDLLPKVQEKVREQTLAILAPWETYDLGSRYTAAEKLDGDVDDILNSPDTSNRVAVPFYQNVTGLLHGQWVRSSISDFRPPPNLNLTQLSPEVPYVTREYNRNITGKEGELNFKLDEKKSTTIRRGGSSVREIQAEMTIKDETSSGDGWEITLHGVHFPESGSILLSTTGDKLAGIFVLPHLARSEASFLLAKELLNRTILSAITRQEQSSGIPPYPWASLPNSQSDLMFPTPHCEFVVYLQENIIWPHSAFPPYEGHSGSPTYLERLEEELRHPIGAPYRDIRKMEFSATVFSPDCGFVLESKGPPGFSPTIATHLRGPKAESFYHSVRLLVQCLATLVAAQIYFLIRQMKDASTPSTRSRVSFYTIAMMAMGDGVIFLSFMGVNMLTDAVFLVIAGTSFLAFLSVSFFGMKFLMDIWTVQAPERLEREREREQARREIARRPPESVPTPAAVSSIIPIITPPGAENLPLPATARHPQDTGATPIIITSDQDIDATIAENNGLPATTQTTTQPTVGTLRRDMGAMYSRFYFTLIGIMFLSLNATTWPTTLRSIYTNFLAFAYLSFWVPQVKRNILRNCRKALRWEFVIGQSFLRFLPIYYFYTYKDNVFLVKTDKKAMLGLAVWLWIQVWVLISQEILGPRFFVPSGWAPPAYDYHPILREDDEEAGATMPLGFTQVTTDDDLSSATTPGESKEHGRKTFDCAICMQDIDVPVVTGSHSEGGDGAGGSLSANLFSRRAYMVTPCRHIFHSLCLEGWMRYKLQCPICRESLPPL